jgi:poly(A) polymerase
MYRLSSLGYSAYLVGGAVRDLYLEKKPKDFDIGTDARPSRLKKVFRNSRIIGRRFRIAHVYFPDGKIIEVATFRRGSQITLQGRRGLVVRDNEYGTPHEDALRRDLTINGLFYDIDSFSVIDYVGGVEDINDGIIRTIADPDFSFREDPVRMIRAQRHAARTGFQIEETTFRAICDNRNYIRESNPSRLLEEILKDLRGGAATRYFELILKTGFLPSFLPGLAKQLETPGGEHPFRKRSHALDQHTQSGATYSSPVLLALLLQTLLWPKRELWTGAKSPSNPWSYTMDNFVETAKYFRVSRRDKERVAQILGAYPKLLQQLDRGRVAPVIAKKPYFLDALDFLELDLESQGKSTATIKEWRRQAPPVAERETIVAARPRRRSAKKKTTSRAPAATATQTTEGAPPKKRPRRRRRGKKASPGTQSKGE